MQAWIHQGAAPPPSPFSKKKGRIKIKEKKKRKGKGEEERKGEKREKRRKRRRRRKGEAIGIPIIGRKQENLKKGSQIKSKKDTKDLCCRSRNLGVKKGFKINR